MTISGTPWSAASRASASSSPTPQTSLSRSAPAASAASATAGLVVSMLIGMSGSAARRAAMTGTTRRALLVRRDRFVARPGRFAADVEEVRALVDHPPAGLTATDRVRRPAPRSAARRRAEPSPENESGVTLRMPMTYVRAPQRNVVGPMRDGAGRRRWRRVCRSCVLGSGRDRAAPGRRRGAPRTAPTR